MSVIREDSMIRPIETVKDLDYIIDSHWRIYNREYNFDQSFKDFINQSVASFWEDRNTEKEQVWLVDINGKRQGSIGIIDAGDGTAQLRWFLVEPECRGQGYGAALLDKAIHHCTEDRRFEKIMLWTSSALISARELYRRFGFMIVETRHSLLSQQEMTEEKWELTL